MSESAGGHDRDRAAAVIDTLLAHRSVRHFTPGAVHDDDIRRAVAAGQMASTSSNVQAYSIIRVTDAETRATIAELAGPQAKIVECGAFFVICADGRRHRLICERAGKVYQRTFENFLVGVIDAALFAQNLCVAFEAMGYGICYIGGIRNDLPRVDRLLGLPGDIYPLFGLCVGREAANADGPGIGPAAQRPRLPVDAVLATDGYPSDDEVLAGVDGYDETYRRYMDDRGGTASGVRAAWSEAMTQKLSTPTRTEIGSFYEGKGANLG
jgi:FMN reductase (NADPH)